MKKSTLHTTRICAAASLALLAGCASNPTRCQNQQKETTMPELVKLEIIEQPEVVIVGKSIRFNPLDVTKSEMAPHELWARCFADGTYFSGRNADTMSSAEHSGVTAGFSPFSSRTASSSSFKYMS